MDQNLMLVTDFYEYTMAYAYFKQGKQNDIAYFDMIIRTIPDGGGYMIFNGLHALLDFIKHFKFSKEQINYLRSTGYFDEDFLSYLSTLTLYIDLYSVPEGTPVFGNEPLITVRGSYVQAQIIESILLQFCNYSTLIATKASRIVRAAKGRSVLEFGARRAQGYAAAIEGARAAMIAGCSGTSNTAAGMLYDLPVSGTIAHSYIQLFDNEYDAFLQYAKVSPDNCVFLVDTYDTLRSGIPNAIKVAKEYLIPNGHKLNGIRLDSGDLAYLSKKARSMLDEAGLEDTKIVASNSLDEFIIAELIRQDAAIDIFGVGENLITAKSNPVIGGVYKVVAYEENGEVIPTIKISDNVAKITNPGYKKLYRFYDRHSKKALADLIALWDEVIPQDEIEIFDPQAPWKRKTLKDYEVRELQVPVLLNGKQVYECPSTQEVIAYHKEQMETLWEEVKRQVNPHQYYVDLSQALYDLKHQLLKEHQSKK
ncbi:MAG: nicotinate phosphoribosyltransferase [Erysipelotrichaceae bacterium]|jgi:nicotinate phosphoribosyltransferase|nr:nicotinate phosphoribosyltransferase [Erysipelotrichaceae bacterium]